MEKFIPLSVPNLKGNEEKYVIDAIRQEWVSTAGAYITKFEENIAEYVNTQGAVACQSGTAGLHLALKLSDVKQNDEVIVPTLTFIAAVNPVKYLGAEPIFMDCDDTLCMDMDKVEKFCQEVCEFQEGKLINKLTKRTIKAMVVVHVFGNLTNMQKALYLCNKYNLKLIEDATEALGTYYIDGSGRGVFAGTIGDFGIYSFNGNKIITTGGGGMLVAKCSRDLAYAKYLSTQAKDDELNYVHHNIGYNYRMTNVQAAIGLGQLEQLETFIRIKEANYQYYKEQLEQQDIGHILSFREDIRSNYWFYSLLLNKDIDKRNLIDTLQRVGIQTRPIWGLIHQQRPYKDNQSYEIDKALSYQSLIINLPCSSNLKKEDIDFVIRQLSQYKEG